MNRYIVPLTMIAALSFLTAGCDKAGASEEQREMKATEQAAAARNEAQEKVATAQAQADKDIAAAQTDFAKTRENYRHARWTDVADLDKKVVDLQAKQQTATGRTKAELNAVLPTIRAKRDVFARDMQALDSATGSTWDQAKVNLDKEWESLKATVDGAP
jgi:hypothetical protein